MLCKVFVDFKNCTYLSLKNPGPLPHKIPTLDQLSLATLRTMFPFSLSLNIHSPLKYNRQYIFTVSTFSLSAYSSHNSTEPAQGHWQFPNLQIHELLLLLECLDFCTEFDPGDHSLCFSWNSLLSMPPTLFLPFLPAFQDPLTLSNLTCCSSTSFLLLAFLSPHRQLCLDNLVHFSDSSSW